MKTTMDDPEDGEPQERQDTRPPGYGVLGETYEWVSVQRTGARDQVRARCIQDDKIMTYTAKVDPRYGVTTSKHTRGPHSIRFEGKPVACWECTTCKQWVVQ